MRRRRVKALGRTIRKEKGNSESKKIKQAQRKKGEVKKGKMNEIGKKRNEK